MRAPAGRSGKEGGAGDHHSGGEAQLGGARGAEGGRQASRRLRDGRGRRHAGVLLHVAVAVTIREVAAVLVEAVVPLALLAVHEVVPGALLHGIGRLVGALADGQQLLGGHLVGLQGHRIGALDRDGEELRHGLAAGLVDGGGALALDGLVVEVRHGLHHGLGAPEDLGHALRVRVDAVHLLLEALLRGREEHRQVRPVRSAGNSDEGGDDGELHFGTLESLRWVEMRNTLLPSLELEVS
mmetsp:Transcript_102426/g.221104  ORF Transcript_102426/g.221104 Transcript_102426/m.221104 type:complete len:240 (+) Transcript_102426:78-797(+)